MEFVENIVECRRMGYNPNRPCRGSWIVSRIVNNVCDLVSRRTYGY